MKYMFLLYHNETNSADATPEQMQEELAAYGQYSASLDGAGISWSGEGLHPTSAATTVQINGGETLTTHGPFAEKKEHLGGYYVVDVPNLDEAIAWAAKCPAARGGKVEIRPIMDYDL